MCRLILLIVVISLAAGLAVYQGITAILGGGVVSFVVAGIAIVVVKAGIDSLCRGRDDG